MNINKRQDQILQLLDSEGCLMVRIAVADGSKIGKTAFVKICAIDDLDILITDSTAPDDLLNQFRKAGAEVIVA